MDEGSLNTISATLATALPVGGGAPAAPGPPVAPATLATLSEISSADQMEVREVLYTVTFELLSRD